MFNRLCAFVACLTLLAQVAAFAANERVHTVTFRLDGPGELFGEVEQVVRDGEDCTEVTAATLLYAAVYPGLIGEFLNWTLDGEVYSSEPTITVRNVSKDMTLIAHIEERMNGLHTVRFEAEGLGGVSGSTTQEVLHGEDCTEVIAEAMSYEIAGPPADGLGTPSVTGGYGEFVSWTLDGQEHSTNPVLTVTNVSRDMTFVAHFFEHKIPETDDDFYSVTFVAEGPGEISGISEQTVSQGGNCMEVIALPYENLEYHKQGEDCSDSEHVSGSGRIIHEFVNWTLDGEEFSTEEAITVTDITRDMKLVANFVLHDTDTSDPEAMIIADEDSSATGCILTSGSGSGVAWLLLLSCIAVGLRFRLGSLTWEGKM